MAVGTQAQVYEIEVLGQFCGIAFGRGVEIGLVDRHWFDQRADSGEALE